MKYVKILAFVSLLALSALPACADIPMPCGIPPFPFEATHPCCGGPLFLIIAWICFWIINSVKASNRKAELDDDKRKQRALPAVTTTASEFLSQDLHYYYQNRYKKLYITGKVIDKILYGFSLFHLVLEGNPDEPNRVLKCSCEGDARYSIQIGDIVTISSYVDAVDPTFLQHCEIISRETPDTKPRKSKLDELTESAANENSDAQFQLGKMYALGEGVTQSNEKATYWLAKAASNGNVDAMKILKRKSDEHLFNTASKGAEDGNYRDQYALGLMYLEGELTKQDTGRGIYWLTKSAEQGYSEAQFRLSLIYGLGDYGVKIDPQKSISWARKAADQGHKGALELFDEVGRLYEDSNSHDSVNDIIKKAEAGNVDSQFTLGQMYAEGTGVNKDEREAVKWFLAANKQGHRDAITAIRNYGLWSLLMNDSSLLKLL